MTRLRMLASGDRKPQGVHRGLANLPLLLLLFNLLPATPSPQASSPALSNQEAVQGVTPEASQKATQEAGSVEAEKDLLPLDPGQPVKRELAGGQHHTYRIRQNAERFLKVVVKQEGIDVGVKVSGP